MGGWGRCTSQVYSFPSKKEVVLIYPWKMPYVVFTLVGVILSASSLPAQEVVKPNASIIKISPQVTMQSLATRPGTDLVELSNGRRMSLKSLRRLQSLQMKMRAAQPESRLAPAFKQSPAATGTLIKSAADLSAALKRPGTDTVQFPSGRTATVDQIKFLQPLVEERLGRKLSTPPPQSRSPRSIKITDRTTRKDWENIFRQPDDTLLESPSGRLTTVGAIKQYLAETSKSRSEKSGSAIMSPKKRQEVGK